MQRYQVSVVEALLLQSFQISCFQTLSPVAIVMVNRFNGVKMTVFFTVWKLHRLSQKC